MADPWLKFYTTDWRADPRLKMCSIAARGLWIELICLMHEASPYGHLIVGGQCPTDAQLAVLVGASSDEIAALLGELDAAGVFSRTKEGVIYSRKLSRMAKKAATARNNGRKGGNPSLRKDGQKPQLDNPPLKGGDKAQKPEARSQSIEEEEPKGSLSPDGDGGAKPLDEAAEAVAEYNRVAQDAGWPKVQVMSKTRRAALNARLRECGGLDGWLHALAKARASPHLCGDNDRGWRADFDFITSQTKFAKILEGSYDQRQPSHAGSAGQRPTHADAALENIARLAGLGGASRHGRA